MKVLLIKVLARLLSLPPLSLNRALGAVLGWVFWITRSRARRVTEKNLAMCFPLLKAEQHKQLAYNSLIHTGKQLIECPWIWHRAQNVTRAHIIEIIGEQLVDEALSSESGLIMVTPHMGNWELCTLVLSAKTDFTYFYKSPRHKALEPVLIKWRTHLGGSPASLTPGGIRNALRKLKNGGTLGILPDQEPDRDSGVFVPFFDEPALTMTLLSRLALKSGANVIYMVAERLLGGTGWRIHYLKADPDTHSSDIITSATAVNKDVARCIAISPEQYLWDYKRFNRLEDGTRRIY